MSVSVGVTGVWSHHKSAPWRERWQGCESWPLLAQPLSHGPALRLRCAEVEAESGGPGSKQKCEERGPAPLPCRGFAHVGKHPSGPMH